MPKALYPVLACSFLCLCYFLFHGSSWTSYPRFVLSKEILRLSLRTSSTKEKTLSFSGMKTVTSSDWIPAVAGIQSYREVFEVSAFIVTLIAVSKTSRYNPFALGCSRITRSDIAHQITMEVSNDILFTSVVKQENGAAVGSGALHPTSATRGMHKRSGLLSAG